jgi:hypothetical protein
LKPGSAKRLGKFQEHRPLCLCSISRCPHQHISFLLWVDNSVPPRYNFYSCSWVPDVVVLFDLSHFTPCCLVPPATPLCATCVRHSHSVFHTYTLSLEVSLVTVHLQSFDKLIQSECHFATRTYLPTFPVNQTCQDVTRACFRTCICLKTLKRSVPARVSW